MQMMGSVVEKLLIAAGDGGCVHAMAAAGVGASRLLSSSVDASAVPVSSERRSALRSHGNIARFLSLRHTGFARGNARANGTRPQ